MIDWFKNLNDANKIAVVVPVVVAIIGGLFALFKWLFRKRKSSSTQKNTIYQEGSGNTAIVAEGNKGNTNIAAGDIHAGIDSEAALKTLVDKNIDTAIKLGRSEKEKEHLENDVKRLESLRKTELKDIIKDVVKEVLIDIRNEKDAT